MAKSQTPQEPKEQVQTGPQEQTQVQVQPKEQPKVRVVAPESKAKAATPKVKETRKINGIKVETY